MGIKHLYKAWEHNCIASPLFYLNTEVNGFARLSDRLSVWRQHACSTQQTNFRNGVITHAIRSRHAVTFAMETASRVFCLFNSPCEDNCRLWKSVANKQRASSSQAWVNITPSYGWYCLFVACEINRVAGFSPVIQEMRLLCVILRSWLPFVVSLKLLMKRPSYIWSM